MARFAALVALASLAHSVELGRCTARDEGRLAGVVVVRLAVLALLAALLGVRVSGALVVGMVGT